MVYDFEGKRDTCYDMYITQNKTLDEIRAHYQAENFNARYVRTYTATAGYFILYATYTPSPLFPRSADCMPTKVNALFSVDLGSGGFHPSTSDNMTIKRYKTGSKSYGQPTRRTSKCSWY